MSTVPNYKRIYSDLIQVKYPDKVKSCEKILSKNVLSGMDIIKIEKIIHGKQDSDTYALNQKQKAYTRSVIFEMLDYQKKNKLNNTQLAKHFDLSRNTVAKWKKIFL